MLHIALSDYDHENERHVEIAVSAKLEVEVERRVETNADYLADDAEIPEDWEDNCTLRFASEAELVEMVRELVDELLHACFAYFHEGVQIDDSDHARELVDRRLAAMTFAEPEVSKSEVYRRGEVERLLEFPR